MIAEGPIAHFENGLACFYLCGDLYAVNLQLVGEISQHVDLTPARTAPVWISGLVNLRGQIVTVVDLAKRIGLDSGKVCADSRLLVLKTNVELAQCHAASLSTSPDKVGLLVDAIADVVTPAEDQLEPPPPNLNGIARSFLLGVCKTEDHTIGILDTERILAPPENEPTSQTMQEPGRIR